MLSLSTCASSLSPNKNSIKPAEESMTPCKYQDFNISYTIKAKPFLSMTLFWQYQGPKVDLVISNNCANF